MKKITLIIILFFFVGNVSAQLSGYMGKKTSIIYSGGFGFPYFSSENNSTKYRFGKNHALRLENIYNNSTALALRYKLGTNYGLNETKYSNLIGFEEKFSFYSHTVSLIFKFYRKNTLAPISNFTTVGFGYQKLVLKNMIKPNYITQNITKQNYSYNDIVFHVGFGKNWIISDRVLLGFEFETSMPLGSTLRTIAPSAYTDASYDGSKNGYEKSNKTNKFNFTNELIRLSLNFGFLAF